MAAGGMESMSNVPYITRSARTGAGYGHQTMEVGDEYCEWVSVVVVGCDGVL